VRVSRDIEREREREKELPVEKVEQWKHWFDWFGWKGEERSCRKAASLSMENKHPSCSVKLSSSDSQRVVLLSFKSIYGRGRV
jgi:hypothetical protein